jgi:hypothetical protein
MTSGDSCSGYAGGGGGLDTKNITNYSSNNNNRTPNGGGMTPPSNSLISSSSSSSSNNNSHSANNNYSSSPSDDTSKALENNLKYQPYFRNEVSEDSEFQNGFHRSRKSIFYFLSFDSNKFYQLASHCITPLYNCT